MTVNPSPPRIAELLLSVMLPGGGIRESVLGDSHELYLARGREGWGRANRLH